MLTQEQLEKVQYLLSRKQTPEKIARVLGMAAGTFRYHLAQSGFGIETVRSLSPLPIVNDETDVDCAEAIL